MAGVMKGAKAERESPAPGLLTAAAIFLVTFHLLPLSGVEAERASWEIWKGLFLYVTDPDLFEQGGVEKFWLGILFLVWVLLTLALPFLHPWLTRSRLLWHLCLWSSCLVAATTWIHFTRYLGDAPSWKEIPLSTWFFVASIFLNLLGLIAIRYRLLPG